MLGVVGRGATAIAHDFSRFARGMRGRAAGLHLHAAAGSYVAIILIFAVVVLFKHIPNIKRIKAGTEPKVGEWGKLRRAGSRRSGANRVASEQEPDAPPDAGTAKTVGVAGRSGTGL